MNFKYVKSIHLPEGDAVSITCGGQTIWTPYDPWIDVFDSIEAGTYATDYAIGDCIPLDLGSEGVVNMQIAAFDTDDLADGSGKAHITWISKELLAKSKRWNPSGGINGDGTYKEGTRTIGGWEKSELRAYLKETVKPLIPETVRNAIVEITKSHTAYDTSAKTFTQTTTVDVWVPSSYDIGSLYTELFPNEESRRKKWIGSYSYFGWWLRDAYSADRASCIKNSGAIGYYPAAESQYTCLCFCT